MQFIGHVISTLFKMAEDAVVQDIGDPQPDNLPEEMPQTDESYAEFQDQSDANGADQNISQDTTLQGIELKIDMYCKSRVCLNETTLYLDVVRNNWINHMLLYYLR